MTELDTTKLAAAAALVDIPTFILGRWVFGRWVFEH
jgi:hypothetical protein